MGIAPQHVMTIGQPSNSALSGNGQGLSVTDAGTQGGFTSALSKLLSGDAAADDSMNGLTLSLAALLGDLLPTANQSAESGNGQGLSVTDTGTQGGFTSALSKLLSGDAAADDSMNGLTMSLAALLGGLLPTANQSAEPQSAEELANQVSAVLQANPELLAQLVNMPQMQQWLVRTGPILAVDTSNPNDSVSMEASSTLTPAAAAGQTISLQQAKEIVSKLLQTVKQEPGSLLLGQLLEDLTAMITPLAFKASSEETKSSSGESAVETDPAAESIGSNEIAGVSVKRVSGNQASKHTAARIPLQTSAAIQNRVVFTIKPEPAASKLEWLAAKAAISIPQVLPASKDGNNDAMKLVPLDADIMSNPLPFADPTLLQTMRDALQKAEAPVATDAKSFVQDMSQYVIKNFKIIENGSLSEAKLSLTPANLGQVDVKISMHEGQVVAHFVAQTMAGKEMLESQLPQLRLTLQNLGLQVERLDVSQNALLSSGMFQDQRGGQSFQQSSKEQKNSLKETEMPENFASQIQTIAELRNLAYGTRFNVTA